MIASFSAAFLLALSLCVDCFVLSACSAVTIRDKSWKGIALVALVFSIVQGGLLFVGWALGDMVTDYVQKAAHVIGALLLFYVGGSMVYGYLRDDVSFRNLEGFRNILIGAVATSIDALMVGVSLSLDGEPAGDIVFKSLMVALVTALSVVFGVREGSAVGARYGKPSGIVGGIVIFAIGVSVLL